MQTKHHQQNFGSKLSTIKVQQILNYWPNLMLVWCFLCLIGLCQNAQAFHLPAQKLDERFEHVSFNKPLRYQITSRSVTIDEIDNDPELHHSWNSTSTPNPTFRLDNQALWTTSAIKNANKDAMTVIIDYEFPLADEVNFYIIDSNSNRSIKEMASGTDFIYSQRELPYRTFAVELRLQPEQEVNIYLRVVDQGVTFTQWTLWNRLTFEQNKLKTAGFEGMLTGTLIILAILNIMIFLVLKEKSYLFYSCFLFSFILLTAIMNGAAFQYFWPQTPEVNQSAIYVVAGIVLLFVSLFSKTHYRREQYPKLHLLQYVNVGLAATIIFSPLLIPNQYHLITLVCITVCIVTIGALSTYWRIFKKDRHGILPGFIWTIFLVCGSLLALSRFGTLQYFYFSESAASVAVILTSLTVCLSLVKGIRIEKHETERARDLAAETLQHYFDIYQNAVEGLFTLSLKGNLVTANPQLVEALGYSSLIQLRETIKDQGVTALLTDIDEAQKLIAEVVEKGAVTSREIQCLKKDGSHVWGLLSMRVSNGPAEHEEYIHGAVVDITEKHQAYQKLAYMATHDPLTGTLNRSEFEKKLYTALTALKHQQQPTTMLYLDLERFKLINDTSGHIAGDTLLRQISDQLKAAINNQGVLARLGGDEFAVLLNGITGNEAFVIAYRIIEAVKEFRFLWEERIFTVGVSIGMKELGIDDNSLTQIFTRADAACYIAKGKGRNRIHIYNDDDSDARKHQGHQEWISMINKALENDQFVLYYQCIDAVVSREEYNQNISTGNQQLHYEILLRMKDKDQNIIGPDTFIPSAERYNLMSSIDRWVIRSYFRWLSQNRVHMKNLYLCSINLSGASIADPHFKEVVHELFIEFLIPHNKICFEITESIAIVNLNATLDFIEQFKNQGCRFSLDDFGTGFSSYGYLKNLPVDFVKIDGSFVKDLMIDPIDRAMVNSINDVAKAMGMLTVAEFVESDAIYDDLKAIGVNYAQGYAVHRPAPLSQLIDS